MLERGNTRDLRNIEQHIVANGTEGGRSLLPRKMSFYVFIETLPKAAFLLGGLGVSQS